MKHILLLLLFSLGFHLSSYAQCIEGDCKNGTGIMVFNSGNKYKGEFKNGERHGQGRFVWGSGAKYDGQWQNDKMHGQGTYIYPDRRVYRGSFVNGQKEGKGVLEAEDKTILKKGKWVADQFEDPDAKRYSHIGLSTSILSDFFPDIPAAGTCTYINPSALFFDFGINSYLSIGAMAGYASVSIDPTSEAISEASYSYLLFGGRSTIQFNVIGDNTFVPYVKGMLGYSMASGDEGNSERFEEAENEIIYNAHLGLKAFIYKDLGLFVEGGLGISQLNAGLILRL